MSRPRILETVIEGDDYFAWHQHRIALAGRDFWVCTRAALGAPDRIDPAVGLLAEHLALEARQEILDLRCGIGLAGAAAGGFVPGEQVRLYDAHSVAQEAARRTLAQNGINGVRVEAGEPFYPRSVADVVMLRIPRSKAQVQWLVWQAHCALRPGGRLYLAGSNKEGIKAHLRRLEAVFESSGVLAYRKGHRVGVAQKAGLADTGAVPPPGWVDPRLDEKGGVDFHVQVRGCEIQVRTQPGLFSWDRLDPGSRMLLEAVEIDSVDEVLDLGCGNGVLGAVCAQLARRGSVVLADVDSSAADCARQTLARSGVQNAEVVISDCGERLTERRFDLVLTNPPFHRGRAVLFETAHQFIRDAHRVLREKGRLYLVANRFLPYEPVLKAQFGAVDTVAADGRFQVFRARK